MNSIVSTYPETMTLTLRKNGYKNFGLGISNKADAYDVCVIESIEPNSPADKVGLLKLGDRILAVNRVKTRNLSPEQFSVWKKKALAAQTIFLEVELDVYDEAYKFGYFKVMLERNLKLGLIFEDVKRDNPVTIKGIEKGSEAHRSGQLFPGDQITFFKYKKHEIFDPMTVRFIKQKTVILTVMRDPKRVLDFQRRVSATLKTTSISFSEPSVFSKNSSYCKTQSTYRTGLSKFSTKSSTHTLNLYLEEGRSIAWGEEQDIRVPNPSPCSMTSTTNPFTFSTNSYLERRDSITMSEQNDIRVPNPSPCSMTSSTNPFTFSTNSYLERSDNTTRSEQNDIGVPNPSVCSMNPSTYESDHYTYSTDLHLYEESIQINSEKLDNRVLNPSLCTSIPSSMHTNLSSSPSNPSTSHMKPFLPKEDSAFKGEDIVKIEDVAVKKKINPLSRSTRNRLLIAFMKYAH